MKVVKTLDDETVAERQARGDEVLGFGLVLTGALPAGEPDRTRAAEQILEAISGVEPELMLNGVSFIAVALRVEES